MIALFREEGPAVLHPQAPAAGPHDPGVIAGGAIAGAALSVLERQAAPAGRLAPVTADFIRPAPMEPLTIKPAVCAKAAGCGSTRPASPATEPKSPSSPRSGSPPAQPNRTQRAGQVPMACQAPPPSPPSATGTCHRGRRDDRHRPRRRRRDQHSDSSQPRPHRQLGPRPHGSWLHLTVSEQWPGDSTGLAVTRLSDNDGMLGIAVQAQILKPAAVGPWGPDRGETDA